MNLMFNKCYKLKEIKGIDIFYTANLIDMKGIFKSCFELEYLNLSNFYTSDINNMSFLFYECKKLKEIKGLNHFDTSNVENCQVCLNHAHN